MIEVELRGFLKEKEFNSLVEKFRLSDYKTETDDRETVFYMVPDSTLKIAKLVSMNKAKIAFKSGNIVEADGQEEIEIDISIDEYKKANDMFVSLGFDSFQETKQKRFNVFAGDCELALKWSEDYGYHFEIEKMVEFENEVESTVRYLEDKCIEFGLKPISKKEFNEFKVTVDKKYTI